LKWQLDRQELHLHLVAIEHAHFAEIKADMEVKGYEKAGDQSFVED
jgi:hypothetical protein